MNNRKGFTLIELLIVIAILGVLAVVVLVAINPVQQLARTRDSGRISTVTQLGHAVQAYYTARGGENTDFPPNNGTWLDTLVSAGEIANPPSAVNYTAGTATACTTNVVNNWCYNYNAAGHAIVFATMEADSNRSLCTAGETAYALYSTADGRGGIVCSSGEPTSQSAGVFVYK